MDANRMRRWCWRMIVYWRYCCPCEMRESFRAQVAGLPAYIYDDLFHSIEWDKLPTERP